MILHNGGPDLDFGEGAVVLRCAFQNPIKLFEVTAEKRRLGRALTQIQIERFAGLADQRKTAATVLVGLLEYALAECFSRRQQVEVRHFGAPLTIRLGGIGGGIEMVGHLQQLGATGPAALD